ncbi:hypothetical protein [Thioalbus denitrificans]|uniref:hypothetical protein n=1 Tax=Thioalbus denitrificans TaxID=547122 RepID=UPI0011C026F6|nr:hypothetical protein [Thioalbus denitrificans]
MSDDWWDEQFDKRGEDPFYWWLQARRLKRGADLIWEIYEKEVQRFLNDPDGFHEEERLAGTTSVDIEMCNVYYFLLGLAVEVLAKGILVGRDPKCLSKNKKYNHNIKGYISECGISFDEKKKELLDALSTIVQWKGRYPAPKYRGDWAPSRTSYAEKTMPGTIAQRDRHELEDIYATLNQILCQEHANRS